MADDVLLTFGANIEALVAGVNEASSKVEEFKNRIEEMGRSLLEVAGISLSIAGVVEFVNHFAELGEKAKTIESQLGITNEQFVELSGVARLSGTDIGTLALGMERMTLNMQRSTRDGTNPAAQAVKMLGINAQEFIRMNAATQFETLATAASKFNASMNLTNALMLIGGRGVAQMVSLLREAGTNWKTFTDAIAASSVGLAEAIPKMADTEVKLRIMGIAAESFGARLFSVLKPAIDQVITSITTFLNKLTTEEIAAWVDEALVDFEAFSVGVVTFFGGATTSVEDFKKSLDTFKTDFFKIPPVREGSIAAWIRDNIVTPIEKWNSETKPKLLGDTQTGMGQVGEAFGPPAPTVAERWAAWLEDLRGRIKAGLANIQSDVAAGGKDFGTIPFGGAKAESDARRAADIRFEIFKNEVDTEAKTFQISEAQKVDILKAAAADRMNEEIKNGESRVVAEAKYDLEIAKLNSELTTKISADWKKFADQIATDFSTALDQVLTKQKSFSAAMGAMFGKMIEQMIAEIIKLIAEYAILNAVAGLTGRPGVGVPALAAGAGGIVGAVGSLLGGGGQAAAQTAQLTALTANTAALTANTAAHGVTAAASTVQAGTTVAQTGATVAQTGATVADTITTGVHTGVLLPLTAATTVNTTATIANTIATFAERFGFAAGAWNVGSVHGFPSYQAGVPQVPRTGLAVLHTGEMVIPAGPAQQIREGFGGQSITLQISAMDAQSFSSWMRGGGGNQIVNYVSRAMQNNPSMRPSYTS